MVLVLCVLLVALIFFVSVLFFFFFLVTVHVLYGTVYMTVYRIKLISREGLGRVVHVGDGCSAVPVRRHAHRRVDGHRIDAARRIAADRVDTILHVELST